MGAVSRPKTVRTAPQRVPRFLQIALGPASETLYHLLRERDIGALPSAEYDALSAQAIEVRRMLTGLAKRVDARSSASATPFPQRERIGPLAAPRRQSLSSDS